MTTPILVLSEVANAQSEPHVPINAAIRALEIFGQIVAIAMDQNAPPGSPAEGDLYLMDGSPSGDWGGFPAWGVAYYSGGWKSLAPREGWKAFVIGEDSTFRYTTDSVPWVDDSGGPISVNAADVTYTQGTSPLFSPTASNVAEALDDIATMIESLNDKVDAPVAPVVVDASAVTYTQSSSPAFSPAADNVAEALDDTARMIEAVADEVAQLRQLLWVGLPYSQPGKPGAGAVYNVMVPHAMQIPAGLNGTHGYAGTTSTGAASYSLKKNGGAAFGSIDFTAGNAVPNLVAASATSFAAGDRLTITAPAAQDATMADVGFTLLALRILS